MIGGKWTMFINVVGHFKFNRYFNRPTELRHQIWDTNVCPSLAWVKIHKNAQGLNAHKKNIKTKLRTKCFPLNISNSAANVIYIALQGKKRHRGSPRP